MKVTDFSENTLKVLLKNHSVTLLDVYRLLVNFVSEN